MNIPLYKLDDWIANHKITNQNYEYEINVEKLIKFLRS